MQSLLIDVWTIQSFKMTNMGFDGRPKSQPPYVKLDLQKSGHPNSHYAHIWQIIVFSKHVSLDANGDERCPV